MSSCMDRDRLTAACGAAWLAGDNSPMVWWGGGRFLKHYDHNTGALIILEVGPHQIIHTHTTIPPFLLGLLRLNDVGFVGPSFILTV